MRQLMRSALVAAMGFAVAGVVTLPAAVAEETRTVAILDFDYSDSSGEVADQDAAHQRRLALFRETLEERLAAQPGFQVVNLACQRQSPCTAGTTPPDRLLTDARESGADLLVFGSIHKMSTLVGGGRLDLLDVDADRILMDRVISFRGDSDEAFRRAAEFGARDILRTLDPEQPQAAASERGLR